MVEGVYEFAGNCSRCRRRLVATVVLKADGEPAASPPQIIGSYCECGSSAHPGGLAGAMAVPLTRIETKGNDHG